MPGHAYKYHVVLTPEVRQELEGISRKTSVGVAKQRWAKILLMADAGHTDKEVSEEVGLCERQVVRIRQKFVKSGVEPTLMRVVRSDAGICRVLDGRAEAKLVAIACSTPPKGHDHWTLQLLCDELQRLHIVQSVCRETVRQALKKTGFVPGKSSDSASPKKIDPASSRGWKQSSTSTKKRTVKNAR